MLTRSSFICFQRLSIDIAEKRTKQLWFASPAELNMHRPWLLHLQYLLIPVLLLLSSASSTGASIGDGEFTFDGFFGNDLTMDGEASVSDGLLRLTSGQNQSQGHAFYTYALNFRSAGVPTSSSVPSFIYNVCLRHHPTVP